ncbi:MAG: NAD(P)-dependent alcohol dehydrogenase [Kangiellaceae bacterium]|nr:NAD(P)-dependent alcohol dehydrogenase [Kangiellaceae bacterium]
MKLRYKIVNGVVGVIAIATVSLMITLSYTSDCPELPATEPGENKIKAVAHYCYGSSDLLAIEWVDKLVPEEHEVLVKIHRAGVNPLDYHLMRGSPYIMRLARGIGKPERTIMGADFSGVVEAVGEKVTRFKPGDEVFGGSRGTYSEYITIHEDKGITLKPANISFDESAAVAVAAATALQALRDQGQLKAGERVLINGASGGVGTFAVQIAKAMGAEVAGVCSTRNVEMVKSIGASHVFDYKKEDYTQSGEKYDLIVDMVGNHSISKNRDALVPGGRYVIVGGGKGNWIAPLEGLISAMVQAPFVDEELKFFVAKFKQQDFEYLADLMEAGKVKPQIDRHYKLDQIAEAITYSESRRARGKIIIDVN